MWSHTSSFINDLKYFNQIIMDENKILKCVRFEYKKEADEDDETLCIEYLIVKHQTEMK